MRAMFGLVGVLVTIGVIVWFWGKGGGLGYTQAVLKADQNARQEVNQIAGNDTETGERASGSADFQPLTSGGKLSGILVTRVQPDGAYQRYFGLQRNDTIIAAEYQGARMDIKDMSGDEEMAKAQVSEAYQRHGTLIVVRDEKKITLPLEQPGNTSAHGGNGGDALTNELNAIQTTR